MAKIQPDEFGNTKCVECGQVIHRSDEYYWGEQKNGSKTFIHKSCYEKLPKFKERK